MRTNRIGRMLAFCFALLIAVSAVQCSVVSASAAALPGDTWTKGSITATLDIKEQDAGNVTVNAYKLVSVHTAQLGGTNPAVFQPSMPEYTWESGIAGWVRKYYRDYIGAAADGGNPADDSVQEVFSEEKVTDAATLAEFYGKIEAAIMKGDISGLTVKSVTASGEGPAVISNLTMGVYLVTATGGTAVYRPTVAMITPEESNGSWTITENAQVGLKSSPVSLVKTITAVNGSADTTAVSSDGKRAVAGIGDTVSYKLEVDVPEYPSQSVSRAFIIQDTLPEGLTLTQDTIKVKMSDGTELQNLSDRIRVEGQVLTIDLTPDAGKTIQNPIDGKRKLLVTYDAQLNADAPLGEAGNVNTASLTYSNNPYDADSEKIVVDTATVYTFGIEVAKVAKGTKTGLRGAVFEL
ncbi:MAG: isopeptide-forming domain-containing fimbrial protein, partial [Candidatus Faecousia sp.]|nr:isopeptide-forming domain-containing fimbrial protein [Candidatus Faecousia sp.]